MAPHAEAVPDQPDSIIPIKTVPTATDPTDLSKLGGKNEGIKYPIPNGETKKLDPAAHDSNVKANGEVKDTLESLYHPSFRPPLQPKGVLDDFKSFDVTPVSGNEYPEAKLVDWLRAPNSDELIRDLAITGWSSYILNTHLLTRTLYNFATRCRCFPRSR